jgi:hypothetical protein
MIRDNRYQFLGNMKLPIAASYRMYALSDKKVIFIVPDFYTPQFLGALKIDSVLSAIYTITLALSP